MKNVQVCTTIESGLPSVCGDATQLHQVLLNLCVNARDAMPNGGSLSLSATLVRVDEQYAAVQLDAKPGPYVCFRATDSGTGMPPELLDKICEPFFTTKEIGAGTGLGLSSSLAIVKSHGGFVEVESRAGTGTTFSVYIPCAAADAKPQQSEEAPAGSARGNGELILIVEDEAPVREITRKSLNSLGYRTVVAADGIEGLTLYATQREQVALIITDMMMPGLDGPTMVQALVKMNPDLRIIGVSGVTPPAASLSGLSKFLLKPFTGEALARAVADVLPAS